MEYKVVCGIAINPNGAVKELERKVRKNIEEGFKPQGGVSIYENDAEWVTACQAMVKE